MAQYVTVGNSGVIQTSPDGLDWTTRASGTSENLIGVVSGPSGYAAISSTSTLTKSTDGITWSSTGFLAFNKVGTTTDLLISGGNDIFCVVVNTSTSNVYTSPDGIIWTTRTLPTTATWHKIYFGNGKFCLLSPTSVLTSTDGITWVQGSGLVAGGTYSGLTYGNGIYYAVKTGSSQASASTDGITWTTRTLPGAFTWGDLTYGNGVFCLPRSDYATNTVYTSTNGITWVSRAVPATSTYWYKVLFNGTVFVMIARAGGNFRATSTDGITWTTGTFTYTPRASYGIYPPSFGVVGTKFIVNGNNGTYTTSAMTSTDGVNWTYQNIAYSTAPSYCSEVAYNGSSVCTLRHVNTTLVNALISNDTINYLNSFGPVSSLSMANSKYFVGYAYNNFITSTDLVNWSHTNISISSSNTNKFVIYGNGIYFAVPTQTPYTSTDGITWSQSSASNIPSNAAAFGNGVFVCSSSSSFIYTSTDCITWKPRSATTTGLNISSITFNGQSFVATDSSLGYGYIHVSPDGYGWTSFNPNPTVVKYGITTGASRMVTVGAGGRIQVSD